MRLTGVVFLIVLVLVAMWGVMNITMGFEQDQANVSINNETNSSIATSMQTVSVTMDVFAVLFWIGILIVVVLTIASMTGAWHR